MTSIASYPSSYDDEKVEVCDFLEILKTAYSDDPFAYDRGCYCVDVNDIREYAYIKDFPINIINSEYSGAYCIGLSRGKNHFKKSGFGRFSDITENNVLAFVLGYLRGMDC